MHSSFRPLACSVVFLAIVTGIGPVSAIAQKPAPEQDSTIRVNVELVNVLFTVKAKKGGQLIPNLEKQNFTVFEDGKQQTIQHFSRDTDLPITLGLLIDISASQERLVDIERQAASSFFSSVLRKKDEAFVISFGKTTDLLQDYTNSARQLTASMRGTAGRRGRSEPDGQSGCGSGCGNAQGNAVVRCYLFGSQ